MILIKFWNFLCILVGTMLISPIETNVTDLEYLLMPKLFYLDDYDQCMLYGKDALFCSITVQLSPTDPTNYSNVWRIIQEVIQNPKNYRRDRIRHGICIRDSCPQLDDNVSFLMSNRDVLKDGISTCYSTKYSNLGLKGAVTELHCETVDSSNSIDGYDRAVAVALSILLVVIAYGTYFEGMASYKSEKEYQRINETKFGQIISCFSIRKNWQRLKSSNPDANTSPLKVLNGVRFVNTVLVILAHSCLLSIGSPSSNPRFIEKLTDSPKYMIILNGMFAIETFFVVAGLLLAYHFLLLFEKHKQVKLSYIILAFVNRYVRLTPCLLVMVAINGTWLEHFERGPYWYKAVGTEYRNCRENWWANLLYINNHYNNERLCLQQSWYLATDTQLFAISLFIIVLMWKYQTRIKLILGTSLAISTLILGLVNYIYDFDVVVRQYSEAFYTVYSDNPQWHMTYSSSYSNLSAYVIGLIFGYIFYNCRSKSLFTKKWQIVIWWLLTWSLLLGTIFMGVVFYNDDYVPTRITSAIYVALSRPVFALGIGILMLGISQNLGWLLRDLINWRPLQILGRLTYCVFLVHTTFLRIKGGLYRYPPYASPYVMLSATIEALGISYIFATILCICVEMPVSALQKLFVPQLSEKRGRGNLSDNKAE